MKSKWETEAAAVRGHARWFGTGDIIAEWRDNHLWTKNTQTGSSIRWDTSAWRIRRVEWSS